MSELKTESSFRAHNGRIDHDITLETDRIHGRTALVNNVSAASSLAGAIVPHLPPRDGRCSSEDGTAIVTNDGVTVIGDCKC